MLDLIKKKKSSFLFLFFFCTSLQLATAWWMMESEWANRETTTDEEINDGRTVDEST